MNKLAQKITRTLHGVVESAKMKKTLVVAVDRHKEHPKYHKSYLVTKRYHVHDESGKFKAGDSVTFEACRPLSRTKRWRVVYPKNQPSSEPQV